MVKNIFFDFDGVIADSVNVKTEAFEKIYLPYGKEIAEKVINHHRENGGMSRFEKFKLYHKEYLSIDLDEKGIDELSHQFSEMVTEGVVGAPEVKGSHDFLHKLKDTLNMFVITGTPTEESRYICKRRNIYNCFKGIYGSPQKKGYWSKMILTESKLKPEETIFVGDAIADYQAAFETNLAFYLREYNANKELFKEIKNITRFHDFEDLRQIIQLK